jgi:carboxymethylenebutenolidase
MRVREAVFVAVVGLVAASASAQDPHAAHQHEQAPARAVSGSARDEALPAGEEQAKAALDSSPRHGEWAEIPLAGGEKPIRAWVVYPERKDKAPVVIVIHEIYGLSDWIRGVADQLARDGFLAVAPDLISGMGPGGGGTESAASRDDVVTLIRGLTPEAADRRLDAVREWSLRIPSAASRVGTVGYCWGGSRSFGYASHQPKLDAAVVYYGGSPEAAGLATVQAPVLGLYGGDDARVNATIEPAAAEMKKLGKTYEVEIYEGAGHGFLRAQSGRDGANLKATQQAWPRTIAFLKKHLEKK